MAQTVQQVPAQASGMYVKVQQVPAQAS